MNMHTLSPLGVAPSISVSLLPTQGRTMLIPATNGLYDDGLIYHERGHRAQTQMAVVRRYLDAVNQEMSDSAFSRRTFVQLFAEPGLYRNRDSQEWYAGAALHALSLPGFNHYIYSTLNQQVLATLERRYQTFFSRPDADVYFMGANCNDLAGGIVSESEFYISARRPKSTPNSSTRILHPVPVALTFSLCQSDVYLRWETVAAISRLPYVNLILYYPVDALNRQMPQAQMEQGETRVDAFFGGKAWRDLYRRGAGQSRHEQLIAYYRERLRALGFGEIVTENDLALAPLDVESDSLGDFLMFAAKQPKGAEFWDAVKNQASS